MEYIIQIENFEGPFDLLLELIKKRQMNIYDLQISQITQDYLESLKEMEKQDVELTSGFMEMASILLGIKTKMLIPNETQENDPRANLIEQLINYQEYKESLFKMKELKHLEQTLLKREKEEIVIIKRKGTKEELQKIFAKLLENTNRKSMQDDSRLDDLTEMLKSSNYSTEQKIEEIREQFKDENYKIKVETFFEEMSCKEEIIVSFGVLLELIKLREIKLYFEEEILYLKKHDEDDIEFIEIEEGNHE